MTDHVRDVLEAADKAFRDDGCKRVKYNVPDVIAFLGTLDAFRAAGGLEAYDRERVGRENHGKRNDSLGQYWSRWLNDNWDDVVWILHHDRGLRERFKAIFGKLESPTPQPALAVVQERVESCKACTCYPGNDTLCDKCDLGLVRRFILGVVPGSRTINGEAGFLGREVVFPYEPLNVKLGTPVTVVIEEGE